MPVTVLVHRDNRIAYINRAGQARFGYAEEEIRGRPLYDFLAEESRPLVADRIRRRIAGEKVDDYEVNIVSRTGEPMTAIVRAIPIQFEGGPAVLVALTEITERKRMERTLEASLHEKEALLRELYHRTKNNMQVICAMLALHSSGAVDPKVIQVFQEMENRIMSMALVHQKLYQSRNLDRIDLRDYFRELSGLLLRSYNVSRTRIALPLEMDALEVAIDVAIPLGLILNELISNSLKHAFPGERGGEIRIRFREEDGGKAVLEVSDNGVGLPPSFDFRKEGRMGLQSVFATAEHQLQGRVEFASDGGVKFRLRFPLTQGGKLGSPR
jgi:PAS domain S-box-containing protein